MRQLFVKSKRFSQNEAGSATIEAVLWLPVFIVLLVMIADVSFVFLDQARAMRIIQDGNRAFSVGRLSSSIKTEEYVTAALAAITPNPTVSTILDHGVITTTALIPVSDMAKVGRFAFLSGYNVEVKSQHFLEY